jgi:hypothetical protein
MWYFVREYFWVHQLAGVNSAVTLTFQLPPHSTAPVELVNELGRLAYAPIASGWGYWSSSIHEI